MGEAQSPLELLVGEFLPATDVTKGEGAKPPETYYDIGKKEFLVTDAAGDWLPLNETQYKRVLKQAGLSARVDSGKNVSAMDEAILTIQTTRNLHFAGPVAGYARGIREFGGTRVLVTSSPKIIAPATGDWGTLKSVIEGVLGCDGGVQLPHFYGWVKVGYEALRAGETRPGQALVMTGPHRCGKSLLQNLLTEILGGRAAKPYQALSGGTAFNSDLFGAEHLMIEDEQPSTDIRARRAFGAQIKNVTVNESQRMHAKHRDAIVLRPFWRLSVSLNDEDENVMVLPPLDDSLEDKLMLFRASRAKMPMPSETGAERRALWGRLTAELPGFLHFITEFVIPEELRCPRFGVKHYHHPEIVAVLDRLAPEFKLLQLIDGLIFATSGPRFILEGTEHVEITAEKLERLLLETGSPCAFESRRLLTWNNAIGTYLGRLAKKRPDRIQPARTAEARMWRILPPAGWAARSGDAMTATFVDDLQKAGVRQ